MVSGTGVQYFMIQLSSNASLLMFAALSIIHYRTSQRWVRVYRRGSTWSDFDSGINYVEKVWRYS